MRQDPVQRGVESRDLIAWHRCWIGAQQTSGKGGLCDGDLMGRHGGMRNLGMKLEAGLSLSITRDHVFTTIYCIGRINYSI